MLIGDATEVNTLHMNLSILSVTAKLRMFSLPRQDRPIRKDDQVRRGSDTAMLLYCHTREQRGQKHGVPRSPSLQQSNPHLTHTRIRRVRADWAKYTRHEDSDSQVVRFRKKQKKKQKTVTSSHTHAGRRTLPRRDADMSRRGAAIQRRAFVARRSPLSAEGLRAAAPATR